MLTEFRKQLETIVGIADSEGKLYKAVRIVCTNIDARSTIVLPVVREIVSKFLTVEH